MVWTRGWLGGTGAAAVTKATWLILGIATPLTLANELGMPPAAVALLVGLLGALAVTFCRHQAIDAVGALRTARAGHGETSPLPSSRIPDPVHHPVRPRAPGLV